MRLINLRFDDKQIYAENEAGQVMSQSLLWYPALAQASDAQKQNYTVGLTGFHWRELDVDISFESFCYEDAQPSPMQEFFLTHKEINIAEFSKRVGLNATLMRNYINGFKKPSEAREAQIMRAIYDLGQEYMACALAELKARYGSK
ncbi:MAG: DUF2442 domain-containing protein [Bacteroidales bacterium]|nr:DUF2442 domain-containing protein [Bacteroidales bacterium]